ncbi:MAG: hypothetical protein H0W84_14105 [Bacteroidetes bacterium]|nr:hypothetical protein [Bacteroidota bacterium]
MFIGFFKSNNASSFVFLPFVALAIWMFGFISPVVLPVSHTMPLYELIAGLFSGIPLLNTFIGFLLIIAEAFLLNYIVTKNEVIIKQSYLPALFYIILMGNNISMLTLYPPLFANLFLLFALNTLLSSYRKDVAFSQVFDAGILVSIASLFYFPSIIFLPVLGIGLLILRPFIWREWVISFIGVIVPYLFIITYYFYNDTLNYLWYDKFFFPILEKKSGLNFPKAFYLMLGISSLIILFSFGKVLGTLNAGAQKTKKGILLLIWLFIFSCLSVFIAPEITTKYFAPMLIPASVFCAYYFVNIKKRWWAELLFLLLIVSIFVNLYIF